MTTQVEEIERCREKRSPPVHFPLSFFPSHQPSLSCFSCRFALHFWFLVCSTLLLPSLLFYDLRQDTEIRERRKQQQKLGLTSGNSSGTFPIHDMDRMVQSHFALIDF